MLKIINPRCQAFVDHWRALPRRQNALVPHTDDYLDQAPARLMQGVFIHEVLDDSLIVRFMGTELVHRWRRDDTGKVFGAHLGADIQQRLTDIAIVLTGHPCGLIQHGLLGTSAGREASFEGVLLPLIADAGAPPRIVVYSVVLDPLEREEHGSVFASAGQRVWMDIGAGVPDQPPPPQI